MPQKTEPGVRDLELAATALVDAVFTSDEEAARSNGMSPRTIRNYRNIVRDFPQGELAAIFHHKRKLAEEAWAHRIPAAIRSALDYLERAPHSLEYTPEGVRAVAGAAKLLSEIELTKQVLDERMRSNPPQLGAGDAHHDDFDDEDFEDDLE